MKNLFASPQRSQWGLGLGPDGRFVVLGAVEPAYWAFCIAYCSINCLSIENRRNNSIHKCLDKEIEIKKTEINLQGQTFKLSLQELNNLKEQLK